MGHQLNAPKSLNSHANRTKSPVSWQPARLQRLSLEPKMTASDPVRFTARVDLGSLTELSGGGATALRALRSAGRASGDRPPLPSPVHLAGGVPLPTSRFNAAIHRALPICQHGVCQAHHIPRFLLSPQRSVRWRLRSTDQETLGQWRQITGQRGERSFTANPPPRSADFGTNVTPLRAASLEPMCHLPGRRATVTSLLNQRHRLPGGHWLPLLPSYNPFSTQQLE